MPAQPSLAEDVIAAERDRMARELHDTVGQALYGIALGARTARELLPADPQRASQALDYVLELIQRSQAELRALILGLRPNALDTDGLVVALLMQAGALCAQHGIELRFDPPDEPRAPIEVKDAVLKIALEAVHNATKHARASRIEIRLHVADASAGRQVELCVSDDGIGFDSEQARPGHFGLRTMRERAQAHGGTLEIETRPGAGARVCARLPLPPEP